MWIGLNFGCICYHLSKFFFFLAVLGLCCSVRAFYSRYAPVSVPGLLTAGLFCSRAQALGHAGFSSYRPGLRSCGARA